MTSNRHDHNHDHGGDLHDRGLQFDLNTLMRRRNALKLFMGVGVGAGALALVGCGDEDNAPTATAAASGTAPATGTASGTATTAAATTATGTASATATVTPIPTTATPASACVSDIPEETAGPFPGNGSNGPNVLTQSGIVRKDIRPSFGSSTNVAKGIPLTIALTILDTNNGCKPMAGAAVYLWQCDIDGAYSLYSQGVTNENYLRGVQEADANGLVTFQSIFPGCYSGRWPHIHFEVYPSLASANASGNKVATSQLALPKDVSDLVYATDGYSTSVRNLSQLTLAGDGIFRDGYALQLATMTGSVSAGYTATLPVGV